MAPCSPLTSIQNSGLEPSHPVRLGSSRLTLTLLGPPWLFGPLLTCRKVSRVGAGLYSCSLVVSLRSQRPSVQPAWETGLAEENPRQQISFQSAGSWAPLDFSWLPAYVLYSFLLVFLHWGDPPSPNSSLYQPSFFFFHTCLKLFEFLNGFCFKGQVSGL